MKFQGEAISARLEFLDRRHVHTPPYCPPVTAGQQPARCRALSLRKRKTIRTSS